MKINNLKFLMSFLTVILLSSGCDKEEKVASKITFWPNIVINGSDFVVVKVGDTYTDQSATVTVNNAPIPFETESDVDASEVGAYTVTYSAINEDGISASKVRTVIVVDPAAAADDLTGSFTRVGQAGTVINWAKHPTKPYTYIVNNVGGVPPSNASYAVFNVQFLAYNVAPGIVVVPLQQVGGLAPFFCSATLGGSLQIPFNVAALPGETGYVWVVNGANFGTGLRTFRKL
jgi:Domain of unknown function (DUF5011)